MSISIKMNCCVDNLKKSNFIYTLEVSLWSASSPFNFSLSSISGDLSMVIVTFAFKLIMPLLLELCLPLTSTRVLFLEGVIGTSVIVGLFKLDGLEGEQKKMSLKQIQSLYSKRHIISAAAAEEYHKNIILLRTSWTRPRVRFEQAGLMLLW